MDTLAQLLMQRQAQPDPMMALKGASSIGPEPSQMEMVSRMVDHDKRMQANLVGGPMMAPLPVGLRAPSTPVIPPSGGTTNTPPQAKRFANAQAMMEAYRNGWAPNPVLLQAAQGK